MSSELSLSLPGCFDLGSSSPGLLLGSLSRERGRFEHGFELFFLYPGALFRRFPGFLELATGAGFRLEAAA